MDPTCVPVPFSSETVASVVLELNAEERGLEMGGGALTALGEQLSQNVDSGVKDELLMSH